MSETPDTPDTPAKTPRKPGAKPATPERLERFALFHLERFASSAENLRRVLMRRVRKSVEIHGTDPAEGAAAIDALIEKLKGQGLLDDKAYAEQRAGRLHRRGASARMIAASLAEKGIDRDLIGDTLDEENDADGDTVRPGGDLAAAAALARRRKLGPYRLPEQREAQRQKDLGTFARAGFARMIAERVLDAESPEALRALVDEG